MTPASSDLPDSNGHDSIFGGPGDTRYKPGFSGGALKIGDPSSASGSSNEMQRLDPEPSVASAPCTDGARNSGEGVNISLVGKNTDNLSAAKNNNRKKPSGNTLGSRSASDHLAQNDSQSKPSRRRQAIVPSATVGGDRLHDSKRQVYSTGAVRARDVPPSDPAVRFLAFFIAGISITAIAVLLYAAVTRCSTKEDCEQPVVMFRCLIKDEWKQLAVILWFLFMCCISVRTLW
jgi:hypothetical protein